MIEYGTIRWPLYHSFLLGESFFAINVLHIQNIVEHRIDDSMTNDTLFVSQRRTLPIIDLCQTLHERQNTPDEYLCTLILRPDKESGSPGVAGIRIDMRYAELCNISPDDISPLEPREKFSHPELFIGVALWHERRLFILDVDRLITHSLR